MVRSRNSPDTRAVLFTLPHEIIDFLDARAKDHMRSRNAEVNFIMREFYEQQRPAA